MKAVQAFLSFAVKDLKKAKDFYSTTLGQNVRQDKKSIAWFKDPSCNIVAVFQE